MNTMGRILSAFSAVDEAVQEELGQKTVMELFSKLVVKLASFCYLHGDEVPHNFINSIFSVKDDEVFEVATHFLESGKYDPCNPIFRELQQEILHFSRIVDLEKFEAPSGTKRIWNSSYLEDYLKVFSELITVMRSRLIQRSSTIDIPLASNSKIYTEEIIEKIFMSALNKEHSNYLFFIGSDRRREAKDLMYQYTSLLSYLSPPEALYALTNYIIEMNFSNDVSMLLIYCSEKIDHPKIISWKNIQTDSNDHLKWCLEKLPQVSCIKPNDSVLNEIYFRNLKICPTRLSKKQVSIKVFPSPDSVESREFLVEKLSKQNLSSPHFLQQSLNVLKDIRIHGNIMSIESGHIHLDRQIDCDQKIGFEIGKNVYEHLASVQTRNPYMCPMIDDDHVMIALKPQAYEHYMRQIMPNIDYELIPESSPIIRAIVVELYHRMLDLGLGNTLKKLGNNLYIKIDDKTTCEVFEDFEGRCDTGCVLFEVALLLYRTNPALFKKYFNDTFGLNYDVHHSILDILNKDVSHNEKYKILTDYKMQFQHVLNPRNRQTKLTNLLKTLLLEESLNHLNVLEDYYEHQQDKVRKMLRTLELPINLFSLHFNTQTGRICMKGQHNDFSEQKVERSRRVA